MSVIANPKFRTDPIRKQLPQELFSLGEELEAVDQLSLRIHCRVKMVAGSMEKGNSVRSSYR